MTGGYGNQPDRTGVTPGQEALREAMRLEQARIYGQLCKEPKPEPATVAGYPQYAETVLAAALANQPAPTTRPEPDGDLIAAIHSGATNSALIERFAITYAEARAARKHAMRRLAS